MRMVSPLYQWWVDEARVLECECVYQCVYVYVCVCGVWCVCVCVCRTLRVMDESLPVPPCSAPRALQQGDVAQIGYQLRVRSRL